MRRLVLGPGYWCLPEDLRNLEAIGFPRGFVNLEELSLATRLRVAHLGAAGRLRVRERAAALRQAIVGTEWPGRAGAWREWFGSAYVLNLDAALVYFADRGQGPLALEARLAGGAARPWPRELAEKVRRGFQGAARAALKAGNAAARAAAVERRFRHKMQRWAIALFPRVRVRRCLAAMAVLRSSCPPRVCAAVWRTWWNGWVTSRRMQRGQGGLAGCAFGCVGCGAEDSIEHYASCQAVSQFAARDLALERQQSPAARLAAFLVLDVPSPCQDKVALTRRALLTAVVYRTHCLVRHGAVPPGAAAREALRQSLRELVRGHAAAERALPSP